MQQEIRNWMRASQRSTGQLRDLAVILEVVVGGDGRVTDSEGVCALRRRLVETAVTAQRGPVGP